MPRLSRGISPHNAPRGARGVLAHMVDVPLGAHAGGAHGRPRTPRLPECRPERRRGVSRSRPPSPAPWGTLQLVGNLGPLPFIPVLLSPGLRLSALPNNPPVCTPPVSAALPPSLSPPSLLAALPLSAPATALRTRAMRCPRVWGFAPGSCQPLFPPLTLVVPSQILSVGLV